ncbi:MAG: phosphatidylserine decarboxylase family protein [Bacteroidota bacterium]|nr:phosphatidylserine decarboxylase family protein [Bacteroidota bacterium]MDP4232209.1 phosphatidylserine decarboxylase family protein [Bacteroidota bacterium]MDP4243610.1 phosphatidylserine decarboxylase family protein [Bacteroidota bacterium]MDP4288737.1 phosphatidylserine decarboxylase family protein [Bacteroidota bacterium]
MHLTRYGTDVLLAILAIVIVLVLLAIWTDERWLRYLLVLVALFLTGFSLNFFRDPDRSIAANGRPLEKLIVSPADGKIVLIKQMDEPEFLKGPATLVSIFMSPLDVHVNRAPISGHVEYFRYVKGEFLVAHDSEAVHRNERAMIGLASGDHKLLFAQVAGYIARRIVCPLKVGDSLSVGERFGMIKFGSRVDLYLPPGTNVLSKIGETVKAGETVLAEYQ